MGNTGKQRGKRGARSPMEFALAGKPVFFGLLERRFWARFLCLLFHPFWPPQGTSAKGALAGPAASSEKHRLFWAWSRFFQPDRKWFARSPSKTLLGDFLAAVGRQAVHHQRPQFGAARHPLSWSMQVVRQHLQGDAAASSSLPMLTHNGPYKAHIGAGGSFRHAFSDRNLPRPGAGRAGYGGRFEIPSAAAIRSEKAEPRRPPRSREQGTIACAIGPRR